VSVGLEATGLSEVVSLGLDVSGLDVSVGLDVPDE
jgi:hypothetical protein